MVSRHGCHWTLGWKGISVGLCSLASNNALHENTIICKLSSICFTFPEATSLICIFKSVQALLVDHSQPWLAAGGGVEMPLGGLSGWERATNSLVVRYSLLSQAGLKPAILLPQKSWDHMPVPSSKVFHCILQRTTSLCQMRQGHTLVNSRAGSSQSLPQLQCCRWKGWLCSPEPWPLCGWAVNPICLKHPSLKP